MADQNLRRIRVFISSTFQDMQEEREELIKRIFPQLRKRCEARGVIWGEVDLRWGIPDEVKRAKSRLASIQIKKESRNTNSVPIN